MRVLVVEDNATTRVLIQQQIKALGGEASGVGSIGEAVDALARTHFDRVLLDCHLDDTLPEHFAALGPCAARIVAMTATVDAEVGSICQQLGICQVLKKPMSNQALRQIMGMEDEGSVSVNATGEALLRELAQLTDPHGVSEIVESFISNSSKRLDVLRDAAHRADCERLRVVSHTWKGVAGSFGAERLAGLLDQVETAAMAGDQLSGARLLPAIEREFECVSEQLGKLTMELRPGGSQGGPRS